MADESYKGIPQISPDRGINFIQPTGEHEAVDASSADATPSMTNCRSIYADVEGIIKIDYTSPVDGQTHTEVLTVGTAFKQIRNVTKVYNTYDGGSTECTAQVYKDDGSLVVGLKLRR
jgi:hypothetical protein